MKHVRTTVIALLAVGLALPTLAVPASADSTTVSGLVLDSLGLDGLNNGPSASHLSPVSVIVSGSRTTFHTTDAQGGSVNVAVTPPTSATTFTVGSFPLAQTATSTEGALSAGFLCASTGSGTFHIHDVTYTSGALSSFGATWSYSCTGVPNVAYGEIRYQSPTGITSSSAPRTATLAPVGVGSTSAPTTLTLTNNGTVPVTYGPATFTGTNPEEFSTQSNTCTGQTIAPTGTCSVDVLATPSAGGVRSARLQVANGSARGFAATNVTVMGHVAPDAPVSVLAEPAVSGVTLGWDAAPITNNNEATSFQVLRGPDADHLTNLATTSSNRYGDALSEGTAAGTTYVYAVRARNVAGSSPVSATSSATTPASTFTPSSDRVVSWDGSADGMHAGSVTVSDPAVSLQGSTRSAAASGYLGTRSVAAYVVPPTGSRLATGATFPIASSADATHGTLLATVDSLSGYMYSGTVVINRLEQTLDGTLVALDLDASATYRAGAGTDHLQVRVGTQKPYTAVALPPVDAGDVSSTGHKDVSATYTNTGTAPLTLGTVGLTQASSDWSLVDGDTCTGATLAPSAACTVPLHVGPTAAGQRDAVLTVTDSTAAGAHSARLTAHSLAVPLAPTSLTATRSGGKVTISWISLVDPDHLATSFTVQRGPDAAHLTTLGTSKTKAFTDPDTADGTRVYAVTATNVAGTSPASEPLSVNASSVAPTLTGGTTVKTVELTWVPGAGLPANPVTGYRVYRGTTATSLATLKDVTGTSLSTTAPADGVKSSFAVAPLSGSTVGPRSAVLTVTGQQSQLVTASNNASNSPLQVHSLDGAAVHNLPDSFTDDPLRVVVAVSPNGLKVAYVELTPHGSSVNTAIYVRNVDGTGTPIVLYGTGADVIIDSLAWAPNGATLAFSVIDASTSHLMTVTTSGVSKTLANSADLSSPSWLNATTLVAEDDSSLTSPLVTLSASGSGPFTPLEGTTAGMSPSVNAQGTEVAYLVPTGQDDYDTLHVLTLASRATRTLTAPSASYLSTPTWSRNGTSLFFTAATKTRSYGILYAIGSTVGSTARALEDGSHGNQLSVAVSTPDTTGPAVSMSVPAVTTAASVRPAIKANDHLNDVVSYTLSYRRIGASGGYSATTTLTSATPPAIALARGYEYCFTARATDRVGNVSAATPEACTVSPLDDRSLTRSAGFRAVTGRAYYAGTAATTTTRGQALTRAGATGVRQVYVVASTCSTCGTADVLIGSTRVGSINLRGTAGNQRVFTLPAAAARTGAVTVKVTSTGHAVTLDGVGIRR